MALDAAAEADAITAALRDLAPEPTVVPVIKTARPFFGARVGDLRGTARRWLRGHRDASPAEVAELADRLWNAGIREEQLVACFLLAGHPAALAATDPGRVGWTWTALLDNWETTDQLGMNVLGPLVALDPDRRFGLLQAMAGDPHPGPGGSPWSPAPAWPGPAAPPRCGRGSPSCCWPWPPTGRRPCPRPARGCCAAGWSPAPARWPPSSTPTRAGCPPWRSGRPGPSWPPGSSGPRGAAPPRPPAGDRR